MQKNIKWLWSGPRLSRRHCLCCFVDAHHPAKPGQVDARACHGSCGVRPAGKHHCWTWGTAQTWRVFFDHFRTVFSHSSVALFEFPTVLGVPGVPTRFSICQKWNAKLILLGWVRSVVSYPFTPPCILINTVVSPCPLNKTIFPTCVDTSQHLQWVSTWQPVCQFVKFAFLVE